MAFQIKNSNQFRVKPGKYISNDNILMGFPGGSLSPNTSLLDSKELEVRFHIRRKEFNKDNKPKGYKPINQVFNLPYKKQSTLRPISAQKKLSTGMALPRKTSLM